MNIHMKVIREAEIPDHDFDDLFREHPIVAETHKGTPLELPKHQLFNTIDWGESEPPKTD